MKVYRKAEIDTNVLQVGDVIVLNNGYTATCQQITEAGALMLVDQYVAEMAMNDVNSNRGGWQSCDLRIYLNDKGMVEELLPEELITHLGSFENGDTFRLPKLGEMVDKVPDWAEYQDAEQWPLMKDRRNRIAFHKDGRWDWCWCMDRDTDSASYFARVDNYGSADYGGASGPLGVRPAFLIIQ